MQINTEQVTAHTHSITFKDTDELREFQRNLRKLLLLTEDPKNHPSVRNLELQIRQELAKLAGEDYLPQFPVARFPGPQWVVE